MAEMERCILSEQVVNDELSRNEQQLYKTGDGKKMINEQERLDVKELQDKTISELIDLAHEVKIEGASGMKKQELIFAILQAQAEAQGQLFGQGF